MSPVNVPIRRLPLESPQDYDLLALVTTAQFYLPDKVLQKCVSNDPSEAANIFNGIDYDNTVEECCEKYFYFAIDDCLVISSYQTTPAVSIHVNVYYLNGFFMQ